MNLADKLRKYGGNPLHFNGEMNYVNWFPLKWRPVHSASIFLIPEVFKMGENS